MCYLRIVVVAFFFSLFLFCCLDKFSSAVDNDIPAFVRGDKTSKKKKIHIQSQESFPTLFRFFNSILFFHVMQCFCLSLSTISILFWVDLFCVFQVTSSFCLSVFVFVCACDQHNTDQALHILLQYLFLYHSLAYSLFSSSFSHHLTHPTHTHTRTLIFFCRFFFVCF